VNGWVTVFDVASEPFRWGNAGEGLAALAIVALGTAGTFAVRRRSGMTAGAVILGVAVALALFFVSRTVRHRREHEACVEAARRGEGRVVEGVVRDFHPLTTVWQRPASESFSLDGETVRYPLVAEGCGFHRTVVEGGPIREGMRVRLLRWNGEILRVEIEAGAQGQPRTHD